jgi:RNA polymerase sigma-70 factor (ECF subfamily)
MEFPSGNPTPDPHRVFEVLLRQNAEMLVVFIRSILGRSPLVDDVFQETMLVAWRRFDDFDSDRPFGPWLRGIASRTALSMLRKAGRERPLEQSLLVALEQRAARFERQELEDEGLPIRELRDCVQKLPANYRDCIECEIRGDRSMREIAGSMGLGVEVVKKRLQRGRRHLADCLRNKGVFA